MLRTIKRRSLLTACALSLLLLILLVSCVNDKPDTPDTTPAIGEGTTAPAPVDEVTTPAAGEETTPAAGEVTTPAAGEETTPAASEETTPAAGEETTPAIVEPGTTEPVVTEPEPGTTEPVVTETEPVVTETEPVVTETEPVVTETEPVVTEPVVTETEPVVTETEPVVTETEPVVTETEPVVTETEPVVTEPVEPGSSEPEDSEPVEPGSSEPEDTEPVEPGTDHTHTWTGDLCTEGRTCTCGASEPAQGHNYAEGVCVRCGAVEPGCRHESYTVTTVDLAAAGGCGGSVTVHICDACSKAIGIASLDAECEWHPESQEEIEGGTREHYSCLHCSLTQTITETRSEIVDCVYTVSSETAIQKADGSDVVRAANEWKRTAHTYDYTYTFDGETCEDGYTRVGTCRLCGVTDTTTGEGHDYDFKVLQLSTVGACGGSVELSECRACGLGGEFWLSDVLCILTQSVHTVTDGSGRVHTVNTQTCDDCGLTLVVETWEVPTAGCDYDAYTRTILKVGTTELGDVTEVQKKANHIFEYTFLLDGTSCTDGFTCAGTCRACGDTDTSYHEEHITYERTRFDLAASGACGGSIIHFSCACGQHQDWRLEEGGCNGSWESSTGYDNDQVADIDTYRCDICGLSIQDIHRGSRDSATCTADVSHRVLVTVKGTTVCELSLVTVEDAHDYNRTGKLASGATSCEDGVTVTYTCRDCGHSYKVTSDQHVRFEEERIDLGACGSACGGYAIRYSCACGEDAGVDLEEHANCSFDYNYLDTPWYSELGNEGDYYDLDGMLSWMGPESFEYACTSSLPACTYKIRYQSYWLPASSGSCLHIQWEIWDFGGGKTIKRETGLTAYLHTYTTSIIDRTEGDLSVTGETLTCTACGSTYCFESYTNADGLEVKAIREVENLSVAGSPYSYGYTETQNTYLEGHSLPTYYYSKTVNGEIEHWHKHVYTYEGCTVHHVYTDSTGANETSTEEHCLQRTDFIQEPTCTKPGTQAPICMICGKVLEDQLIEIPATGHDLDENSTCYNCGETFAAQ